MKIVKFQKQNKDKYKLIMEDNTSLILYEDVILKNNLLISKNIEEDNLTIINNDNYFYQVYNMAIKYIGLRTRSVYEVRKHLEKKEVENNLIDKVINCLIQKGFLSDEIFVKAYINDKINLTNYGPYKIINFLKEYQIEDDLVNQYLNNITKSTWLERIKKISDKLIKQNKSYSGYILKQKIFQNLINLGYDKELINKVLVNDDFASNSNIDKEYSKLLTKYVKKYPKEKLEYIIKQKLLLKGYSIDEINKLEESK